MDPQHDVTQELTDEQLEILPALVEGASPDVYVVIPVETLISQVNLSAAATARRYRGEVRPGAFSIHLVRALQSVGVLVDTAHFGNNLDRTR